ncbi:MAG TPA: hypothetical protein PK788_12840, partial [Gemmatimonadaceae bacterium]|nr:hypothetical protein [Gemmatimonadaceae bacterium]
MSAERLMVVDLRSTAQAFNLPDRVAQAITDATPSGWRVHIVSALTDSFGDGAQARNAVLAGTDDSLPPVVAGSHLDT